MQIDKSSNEENTDQNVDQVVAEHDKALAKILLNMTCIAGVCFWLNVKEVDGNEDGKKSGL